jgi:restriction system protein
MHIAFRNVRLGMAARKVEKGIFATSRGYTLEAKKFARGIDITLVDGISFVNLFKKLSPEQSNSLYELATQGNYKTPTCPQCDVKMIRRKNRKRIKHFWGCRNFSSKKCPFTFPCKDS